jgi:uncharacterized membrane protein
MLAPQVAGYIPQVITHIAAGGVAILSGYTAVTVRKGDRLHRRFGTVFVVAMLILAGMAIYLAFSLVGVLPGQKANIAAGTLAAYLVATGWMAARRKDKTVGAFDKLALLAIIGVSGLFLFWGLQGATSPGGSIDGYRPVFYFVFAGIAALFAALDIKVIIMGGVSGVQRIARHLWRMCFAFFFAAASFFLGQQKVMPQWMHGAWYLYVLALAPLAVMVFWLIRVRIGRRFKDAAAVPV